MRFIQIFLCIALLAACGCKENVKSAEAEEERNPLVKQGHAYMEIKDYTKAETAFQQALENEPRMARPHLDLGTIYHQYKPDYVSSIFHYKRYLQLRPGSEKADFIREQIEKVQLAMASEILTQSGARKAIQELKQLRRENAELKQQLASLQKTSPQPVRQKSATPASEAQVISEASRTSPGSAVQQKSVTQTVPKSATPDASSRITHNIYTVVAGDNLTKIANTFYGNGDYEAIYQANRDRMKNPNDLREGQTLVIPIREN